MNTFTVRCLGVRHDGRHIHVKFAQPGSGHFNLSFPDFYKNEHVYVPGADYEISLTKTLFSNSPAPQVPEGDIDMSPVGLQDLHPDPETFTHRVTKETLDLNPDMAAQGIKEDDEIEVPLHEDQPLPEEIEADRQAALDALENHEADLMEKEGHEGTHGEAGMKELEDRDEVIDPPLDLKPDSDKVGDENNPNPDEQLKNQSGEIIDGNSEVPDPESPEPGMPEPANVPDTNVGDVPEPQDNPTETPKP